MTIKQLAEHGNGRIREKICPSGHGLVELTGDMNCCTVCGKQNGDECDTTLRPCDSTVGLTCELESKKSNHGICKRELTFRSL